MDEATRVTEWEQQARRMYVRVLSQWAMDLLQLRRDGLDVPCAREGEGRLTLPHWRGAMRRSAWRRVGSEQLRWKPAAA
jgi:hypothetical protein